MGDPERKLLSYFHSLTRGALKSDICRVAALYDRGGYYFDIDMYPVTPVMFENDVQFASAYEPARNGFFQSFLASEPNHPVLKQAITEMIAVHEKKRDVCEDMGTCTLKDAYFKVPESVRGKTKLMQEDYIGDKPNFHTEIKRQNGYGGCCNYVVQDLENDIVHFMSRIVGISKCCMIEFDKKVTKFRYHGKINKNTGGPFFGYDKRDVYHYERDDEIETLKHGNKKKPGRKFILQPKG